MGIHCCWGKCNSDIRNKHRADMAGVFFIPFPKPYGRKADICKAKRWAKACARKNFNYTNINRNTYICSKHFVGEMGPTPEYPDPVSAYIGVASVIGPTKARKPPKPRCTTGPPASKKLKLPGKLF